MAKSLLELMMESEHLDEVSTSSRVEPVRGPFLWPGNKFSSLENILPMLPHRESFIDVFGGSGAVTLNRKVSKFQVFNDANSGVCAFFRVCRDKDKLEQLCDIINLMPHAREEFMLCKRTWEQELDDVVKAAKFYYTVQCSFHGDMRVFGRTRTGSTIIWKRLRDKLPEFQRIANAFLSIQIENLDWRVCLKDFDSKDTVFYLDPPYVNKNCYHDKMTVDDHHEMCRKIMGMKGFVALSGYENEVYDQYQWDHVYSWEIPDRLSTQMYNDNFESKEKGQVRGAAKEVLWIKE